MPAGSTGLAHLVFFALKDPSADAREALIAACRKHLPQHEGVVHFSVGVRGEAYQRPVNDRQFDVALVIVFDSEAAHDRYQESAAHKQFIAEQASNWSSVRVFDAIV
ncbi:MAG: stress responsive protein [Planctomycetota bacterium]|nr:MAG: stress responsive protein [Planctomycetota bacterium]